MHSKQMALYLLNSTAGTCSREFLPPWLQEHRKPQRINCRPALVFSIQPNQSFFT
jgi:hypothetical protein